MNEGRIARYAKAAGRELTILALKLYYVMRSPSTPKWAKAVILGALAYFISPLDGVPDFIPGIGYVDDLGVLLNAFRTVAKHVDERVVDKAEKKAGEWFS